MAFTYNLATDIGKVRFEIQDTVEASALFTDAEIQHLLDTNGSVLDASWHGAEALAARFAGAYDFAEDGQSFKRGQAYDHYKSLAAELKRRAQGLVSVVVTKVDGYSQDIENDDVGVSDVEPRRRFYGQEDAIP